MWPSWDAGIFRAIHHGWHQPWLDPIMYFLTDPGQVKIPLLMLIGAFFCLRGRRGAIALIVLTLTITAADQLSSHILKPIFKRSRPSVELTDSKPLFGVRRSYSFPSTHASNFFSAAPIVARVFPQAAAVPYVVASAVGLSRVYVGDHYPSDVLGGALLGLLLGWLGRKAYLRTARTLLGDGLTIAEAPIGAPVKSRGEEAPSGGP